MNRTAIPAKDHASGADPVWRGYDLSRCGGIQQHPIGANRIGDVLEALLAQAGKADIHLVHRVIECRAGDADAAGLRHRLQARCDVYAIAVDVVVLDDDVAEIDADAKPDLLGLGGALVAIDHPALDHGSALDGIDDAGKLNQRAVAHQLDHAAVEFLDRRVDQFATAALQALERADLVFAHEAAVANHVGRKYCGKPSLHTCLAPSPSKRLRRQGSPVLSVTRVRDRRARSTGPP